MLKRQRFPLDWLIPLIPAFGEEGETSEASLFRLRNLFSAWLLSVILGSGGGDVQGLGTELLHIPLQVGTQIFYHPGFLIHLGNSFSTYQHTVLSYKINESPRAVETFLKTSKVALSCRQIRAYQQIWNRCFPRLHSLPAAPSLHSYFIRMASCWLSVQTAQDKGAKKHMGILQPNPPFGHGAAARGALALALPWVPGVHCCSSLPARDLVQRLVWAILLWSSRPEGTMTWFNDYLKY